VTDTDPLRRFNSDPDALAWARAKVQHNIDKFRGWEREAADPEKKRQWRMMANMLQRQFIGGEGCVIAAFDERSPDFERQWAAGTPVGEAIR
jgi:hypothetical protein